MALAETELEATKNTGPLGRDDFVKRRQEQRAAADPSSGLRTGSGTATPEGGDEISPAATEAEPETGDQEVSTEAAEAAPEETTDDPLAGIFDPDEIGVEEPSTLTGLEPPATMNAAEKGAFESAPDELKGYISRISKSAAQKVQESGETTAARNKEIDDRVAALDQSLAQAQAVLNQPIDDIPFTPPHSQAALAKLLDDRGSEAWIKAKEENEAAWNSHQSLLTEAKAQREKQNAEIDHRIRDRQKEIIAKRDALLPKLIPTWAKPEVRKKEAEQLQAYLAADFTAAELQQIATHAPLIAKLRKAMRYDVALEKRRAVKTGGKGNAPAAPAQGRRSASNTNGALEAAEKRYRKTPSADNFARLRKLKREAAEANIRRRV